MNRSDPRPRWRDRLPGRHTEPHFRWRGKGVSRLENLADGVFAFSVTLLVATTAVPQDFDGLMAVVKTFPAFVASFALLMLFWNVHYKFFRRYGLEDLFTRLLNFAILLLVLFSVYPLKFLFTSWLGGGQGLRDIGELYVVYRVYGAGFAGVWLLYGLLYWHALRQRHQLDLNPVELVLTRLDIWGVAIQIATCLASIGLSYLPVHPWVPGVAYGSLGITMTINGVLHGRQVDRLNAAAPPPAR